ncbi:SepM family pheromone-processing serine protease [Saliterribacillus persicus]|uniref:endopeptidase La n=1 Tax=Saliterribacillus persicus TaxID=930114 RepID=A0A368XWC0_9BACI|nr:SepM family pheromone-processing serine protease [Saliterribacillus persicus]RCW70817.1 PDZ domain-containing protein [Saliterribacillus persicus]
MFQSLDKKRIILWITVAVLLFFLFAYRLPYYIYKPGSAEPLSPVVEVENSTDSEGEMHLVTIQGGQAVPIQYLLALFQDYNDILPIDEVYPDGMSQDDYMEIQLSMMENSQEASTVVAYTAANKDIDITYEGIYVVRTIEGMPAHEVLKTGDKIVSVDELEVKETEELISYVEEKEVGEPIEVTIVRDEETITETIALGTFPDMEDRVGIGVQLVTNRDVDVDPPIAFSSGNIGGPSAGLMFSLEIYDQLVEEDITKGYCIVGTGEVDYDGNVGRIGGIDKKVIAADNEGCDIFFAPNEGDAPDSNFKLAEETAKAIKTDMKIIPVDTFEDAINYLESLDEK